MTDCEHGDKPDWEETCYLCGDQIIGRRDQDGAELVYIPNKFDDDLVRITITKVKDSE